MKDRLLMYFILTCNLVMTHGQANLPQYYLSNGQKYFLQLEMSQNTESDNNQLRGEVSLDISETIEFVVDSILKTGNYRLNCLYNNLNLSFFSPQSDLSISSQTNAFSPLIAYLEKLESKPFFIELSKYGEIQSIYGLDSIINSFYLESDYIHSQHELIIKSVKEAFGEEALKSVANIAMNVYSPNMGEKVVKKSNIIFNAKPIGIQNSFYYMETKDQDLRIQGIGLIEASIDSLEFNSMSVLTYMNGNQTYDYLFNTENGWIIEGISRQKIQSLSEIYGHADLPDGIKIPSYTETVYELSGGQIKKEDDEED
jgi:hypothetical protein